jgi:hypothetical protein
MRSSSLVGGTVSAVPIQGHIVQSAGLLSGVEHQVKLHRASERIDDACSVRPAGLASSALLR